MKLLEAALSYAKKGWKVIPLHDLASGKCSCGTACAGPGKHPRIPDWTHRGTDDEATIRKWWSQWPHANTGVVTGAASGFIVLDVDPRHEGDESLADLEAKHGKLPDTVEAITGGGGRHILFKYPGRPVPNKTALAPGLDIRGDGGQIVVEPSLHASGQHYVWEVDCHPDDVSLAECPAWLLNAKTETADVRVDGWADKLLDGVGEGQRDDACIKLAGRYVRLGLSDVEIERLLTDWNARNHPPMGDAVGDPRDVGGWVRQKIKSARAAENRKRNSTLAFERTETLGAALDKVMPDLLAGNKPELVPFGVQKLDNFLGGMRRGRVVSLAARTSMGKSAAALRFALAAADVNRRVLYVSLEMTGEELALRALSAVTGVKVGLLDTGNLQARHFTLLVSHKGALDHLRDRLTLHFQAGLTPDKLTELVEMHQAQGGVDLLVIDHVGLMQTRAADNEYQTLTKVAQALKSLALSADVPVLALVQLNRMAEDNNMSKPTLRNLRGSGHLEEMSDVVLLLYRAKYYDENAADELEINVAKARQGDTGRITVPFAEILKFTPGKGVGTHAAG